MSGGRFRAFCYPRDRKLLPKVDELLNEVNGLRMENYGRQQKTTVLKLLAVSYE